MSVTTGTAINHNDLIDKLNTWLTVTLGTWTENAYTRADLEALTESIAVGGTGYTLLDILTVQGGTFTTATTLEVRTISGGPTGPVVDVVIIEPGQYSVAPGNPVSVTGGTGSGATFNMTYDIMAKDSANLEIYGPGNGASARVYFNATTEFDEGNDFWGWKMRGAVGWSSGVAHSLQSGASSAAYFNLWDKTIDYWFYANDRRFIVVAKIGSNYMSMYAGFFLPHALNTEYPFPYALIGSYNILESSDLSRAANSMISDPGNGGGAYYRRRTTDTWVELKNQDDTAAVQDPTQNYRALVWPHKTGQSSGIFQDDPDYWCTGGMDNMKTNVSGESVLVQCHIVEIDSESGFIAGSLDGVYSTTGFGRSTEQVLVAGGSNYRLFQRVFKNTPADYFAVKEV